METLYAIVTAIIALFVIVFSIFWLGVGLISLINWTIFKIIDWFDRRRTGK